jgi:phage-related tail fiber protein
MSNARNLARLIVDSGGDLDTSNLGNAPNPINAGTIAYLGMSTAPTGWIKANGAAISRSTYADLFAAIGTTYGSGDGSTTFNIPDLRGQFPRGWDDGRGVDSGRSFASSQSSQNKYEAQDLMVFIPHDGGGNMGATGTNYGLGDSVIPIQLNGTGYPDNYGGFSKKVGYISPNFSVDTSIGTVGGYGKSYNRLKSIVGITGNLEGGSVTQNNEARVTNVALLACIKY